MPYFFFIFSGRYIPQCSVCVWGMLVLYVCSYRNENPIQFIDISFLLVLSTLLPLWLIISCGFDVFFFFFFFSSFSSHFYSGFLFIFTDGVHDVWWAPCQCLSYIGIAVWVCVSCRILNPTTYNTYYYWLNLSFFFRIYNGVTYQHRSAHYNLRVFGNWTITEVDSAPNKNKEYQWWLYARRASSSPN